MDRMWRGAELGVTARLQRKLQRRGDLCGSGRQLAGVKARATLQ
jgi:hypothetical protein